MLLIATEAEGASALRTAEGIVALGWTMLVAKSCEGEVTGLNDLITVTPSSSELDTTAVGKGSADETICVDT